MNIHLLLCSYCILIEVLKWLLPFTKSRCQTTEKNRNERQWMMIIQISSFHYLNFCEHKCSINTDLLSVKKHLFLIGSKCLHKHFVIILLNNKCASQSKIWLKSGYFRGEINLKKKGWKCRGKYTWSNFNEAVVLNEDGVTCEVAVNYGRVTGV